MTYLAMSVSFQYITCSENEGTLLYHAVERRMGRKAKICGCQGDVQNQTQVPSSPWKMGFITQAAAIVPGGFPGWQDPGVYLFIISSPSLTEQQIR